MASEFEVGAPYTREQVAEKIGMPEARRQGGSWATGYDKWNGEYFIFCNVGVPGRTGHDYPNRWYNDQLIWSAKNGTRLGQPQISEMLSGLMPVHVFWRGEQRGPFTYAGAPLAEYVKDTTPVEVTWLFGAGLQFSSQEAAARPLWKRGPPPSVGELTIHKDDGPTTVYLMELAGASNSTFPQLGKDLTLAKIGMSKDPSRRLLELNSGFPPGCILRWQLVRTKQYADGFSAYQAEGELLNRFRTARMWAGGEYVYVSPAELAVLLTE